MPQRKRSLFQLAFIFAAAVWFASHTPAVRAEEDRVVVLTSYPEELTARFQAAFEKRHPGKRVEILWRQSADALAYLRRGGAREVDVYWTPSPGNFVALRDEGRLAQLEIDRAALPDKIAGAAIADAEGRFAAFELAGYGIYYNTEVVRQLGLPPPRDWPDLADARYAGRLGLPIPGRLGFAPPLIETLLQAYGWERGWALLAELAANAEFPRPGAAADPGSDDIVSGRKAAMLGIDFFAARAIAAGAPVRFAYPPLTSYNPAQIAVFKEAPHPHLAREFVAFALSLEGQRLLLHADVKRLPARRELYTEHQELPARPFAASGLAYDAALGRERQGLVAALFELALVERHDELASLWRSLHAAENAGRRDDPAIVRVRALLGAVPLDATTQASSGLRQTFALRQRQPGDAGTNDDADAGGRAATLALWRQALATRIAAARELLAERKP